MPRPRKPRNISLNRLIPSLITLGALCSGLSAVRYAMLEHWERSVAFIVLAALLDGLDGRVARMLKATSTFGAQLDSLSDFICFGVAPVLVIYMWTLQDIRGLGWALVLLYAVCAALRLARFNTALLEEEKEEWQKHFFTGVPSPAAAMLCLLPLVLTLQFGSGIFDNRWLVAIYTAPVGLLMISRIPTFSIKSQKVSQATLLPITLLAATIIVGFIIEPWVMLAACTVCYLGSIPFSIVSRNQMMRASDTSASSQ
jgi:CDP-diacylglycerol---serine O-phosphatidyltransferase